MGQSAIISNLHKTGYYLFFLLTALNLYAQEKEIWLDELDLSTMTSGWGSPKKNLSVLGYTLQINNEKYSRGVGVHAESKFMLNLDGQAISLKGVVGIDDTGKDISSVEFYILGDQKILWQSGMMKRGQTRQMEVDLNGIRLLALYVTDGGDGYFRDYANFINTRIITKGNITPFIPDNPSCEIYTPTESLAPRINGPGIIGIRPGSPVNYRLPVSGQRPIHYTISSLPDGLIFDKEKGILKGTLKQPGTYTIGVTVDNQFGVYSRNLDIAVGQKIALTPPMGWNSWNIWGASVTGDNIRNAGKAIIENRLNDYGWSYVIVDDGWQNTRANSTRSLQPNAKFNDLPKIIEELHEEGLKFGIYSTPWITSFAGFCGSSSESPKGEWKKEIHGNRSYTKMGQYRFEKEDIAQYAAWGVDYLKYDWNPIDTISLTRIGKEIKSAPRDIVLSISNSGFL